MLTMEYQDPLLQNFEEEKGQFQANMDMIQKIQVFVTNFCPLKSYSLHMKPIFVVVVDKE